MCSVSVGWTSLSFCETFVKSVCSVVEPNTEASLIISVRGFLSVCEVSLIICLDALSRD